MKQEKEVILAKMSFPGHWFRTDLKSYRNTFYCFTAGAQSLQSWQGSYGVAAFFPSASIAFQETTMHLLPLGATVKKKEIVAMLRQWSC